MSLMFVAFLVVCMSLFSVRFVHFVFVFVSFVVVSFLVVSEFSFSVMFFSGFIYFVFVVFCPLFFAILYCFQFYGCFAISFLSGSHIRFLVFSVS